MNSRLSTDAQAFLLSIGWPEAFPSSFAGAQIIETHISIVLIATELVLKFKKAVHFPFLDNRTLENRWKTALAEVRLNRRFSKDIYLGVLPVPLGELEVDLSLLIEDSRDACDALGEWEPAVVMSHIPDELFLEHLIHSDTKDLSVKIDLVAKHIVRFHTSEIQKNGKPLSPEAAFDSMACWVRENFEEFRQEGVSNDEAIKRILDSLEEWSEDFIRTKRAIFLERTKAGYVIDGHGDLRAEHVVISDSDVSLIDCLEFSEELRTVDVLNDLAFLLSDLVYRKRGDLAEALSRSYAEAFSASWDASLVRFYTVYRLLVRAKVSFLAEQQLCEADARSGLSHQPSERVRRYVSLASRLSHEVPDCFIVLMCGRMGVGKSTIAQALADTLGLELLQTDALRLQAVPGPEERVAEKFGVGRYSLRARNDIYQQMCVQLEALLEHREPVLLDGSFSRREWREQVRAIAKRHGVSMRLVYCTLSEEEQGERLRERSVQGGAISEGREELAAEQSLEFESPDVADEDDVIRLDAAEPIENLLKQILSELQRFTPFDRSQRLGRS